MSRDIVISREGMVHTENGANVACPMNQGMCNVGCAWFKVDMPMKLAIEKDGKTTIQSVFCGDKFIGEMSK